MAERNEESRMSFFKKLEEINVRVVFLLIVVAIVIPIYYPLALPMTITERTREFYRLIDNLPSGSIVGFGIDTSVGGYPEARPATESAVRHLFSKPVKIIFWSTYIEGPLVYEQLFTQVEVPSNKKYGVDYAWLGFIAGTETAQAALARDLPSVISKDYFGKPISELPVMKDVKGAKDFALVITNTVATDILEGYVRQWVTPYGAKYAVITLAIMAPSAEPYYPRQIVAMITSQRQGAEYEMLLKKPGYGVQAMDVQNVVHLVLLAFIVLGNVSFLYVQQKEKR